MGQKYTFLDRALLLGSLALMTVLTYKAVESVRNSVGESYLTVWPLNGHEVALIFLIGFIAASIDVYRDWAKNG